MRIGARQLNLILAVIGVTALAGGVAIALALSAGGMLEPRVAAVVFTAWLATIGWLYTNYRTAQNALQEHTHELLILLRTNSEFKLHRRNVFAHFGYGHVLTQTDLETALRDMRAPEAWRDDKLPAADSIRFIFNLYEFVAYGVRSGGLEYKMIYETISPIMTQFYKEYKVFVDHFQAKNDVSYIHMLWLLERFARDDQRRARRV